jgi:phage tail-like protein
MAAGAVRVLVTHHDPGIRRRLRQALLGEPDIELLDADGDGRPGDLAERVRRLQPDILMTDGPGEGPESERLRAALRESQTPARVVLVDGAAPSAPPPVPVDGVLSETATRAEIVRSVRQIQAPSGYLAYLPALFGQDDFLGRFLRIFESVIEPIDRQIDGLEHYFDPDLTPDAFLPWLASWLDVALDDRWPRARQVALIRAAPELHRWRGTRRGLAHHLRLYLDVEPEIEEAAGGLRLGPSTQLGFRTILGESGPRHHFTVTLRVPDPSGLDYAAVAALIDAQKPAHCTYSLVILPRGGQEAAPAAPDPAADQAPPPEEL